MKYEPPFGSPGSNDPYINGNPSTGTMGSIPPAASIENPQREIVNFINDSGLTATDADLHQLSKSVQSGKVNYSLDTGPPNLLYVTAVPPITGYQVGLRFIVKVANPNSSAVQVSVSGLGAVPLVHRDLTPMGAGEVLAGSMIDIVYDGTHFQLLSGGSGQSGQLIFMTAPRDVYVSDSLGDDTLYDGSAASVGTGGVGPYKTIQKALATMTKYNLGGWSFNIHVADATYTYPSTLMLPLPNGSGRVNLIGNVSNPAAVVLNPQAGACVYQAAGGVYSMQGFKIQAMGSVAGDNGAGLSVANGNMEITNCHFGQCTTTGLSSHMAASGLGSIYVGPGGTITIDGNATYAHQWAMWGAKIIQSPAGNGGPNLVIGPSVVIAPNVNAGFGVAWDGAIVLFSYTNITGKANCIGYRYFCMGNGIIDTGGGGATYLPGNAAGVLATGGQYL
jgi:hypothetical protein